MGKEADVEARWPDGTRAAGRPRYEPPKVMAAARACGLVDTKVCAFSAERPALKFVRRRT